MLKVFNDMTKKKEKFEPIEKGKVRMYVCGPTVYNYIHIGNARTFLNFDIIRRYLEYKGFDVKFVQNITDVGHLTEDEAREDKIVKEAEKEKITPKEVARKYEEAYFEDLVLLNIKKPDVSPRATEHIQDMIKAVEILIEKGYAYVVNGSVYFDITKFKDYGKLSGNTLEALREGASERIDDEETKEKKSPFDFALWKRANSEHYMQWDSPWGKGYPGWHLECSVMALKYLGKTLDIHGGGKDLIFPHHENEIAQSEALNDVPFVHYWLHGEFIQIKGEKMAKSKGNFFTSHEMVEKYGGRTVRFFLLNSHYRKELNLTDKGLEDSKNALERLDEFVEKIKSADGKNVDIEKVLKETQEKFEKSLDNDFDMPSALAVVFDMIRLINKSMDEGKIDAENGKAIYNLLIKFDKVLGILKEKEIKEEKIKIEDKQFVIQYSNELTDDIKSMIIEREKCRLEKDYKKADEIRIKLKGKGIIIEDKENRVKVRRGD